MNSWNENATLLTEEPRRGKTTYFLHEVEEWPGPTVLTVPTVGSTVGPDGEPLQEATSPARDIEDKIDDLELDLDVIQAHGVAKCPVVDACKQRQEEDGNSVPYEVSRRYHGQKCSGEDGWDEENGWESGHPWSDGDLRLDDYPDILDQGYCPVEVAKTRARQLDETELLVTTVQKLVTLKDEMLEAVEDPSDLRVGIDEFHDLDAQLVVESISVDWPIAGASKHAWEMNIPPELSDNGAALVQWVLDGAWTIVEETWEKDAVVRNDLFELSKLREKVRTGQVSEKSDILNQSYDIRDHFSDAFNEANPDFVEELFSKDQLPDDGDGAEDLMRGFENGLEACKYRGPYLSLVYRYRWLDLHDEQEFFERLAELWGIETAGGVVGRGRGTFDFRPPPDSGPPEHATAVGEIKSCLKDRAEELIDGEVPVYWKDWHKWANFVSRAADERAVIVPVPRWDLQNFKPGGFNPKADGFDLYAVRGSLDAEGTLRRDPVMSQLAREGVDLWLLSATPPPGSSPTSSSVYMDQLGIHPETHETAEVFPPPEMTLVCEKVNRSVSQVWHNTKGKREQLADLLERLIDQSTGPVYIFARNDNDDQSEADWVRSVVDEVEEKLGLPDDRVEVYVARSHESQAVQLDTSGFVVFTGPPLAPPDQRLDRVYGYTLSEEVAAEDPAVQWSEAVTQVVQTAYRTAEAGEPAGAIVLSTSSQFRQSLRRRLGQWEYESCQVEDVEPTTGQGAMERRARKLLDEAGIETRRPHWIREAAERICRRLELEGPAYKTDIQKKPPWTEPYDEAELDVSTEAGYSQSDRGHAVEWGLQTGALATDEDGRIVAVSEEE